MSDKDGLDFLTKDQRNAMNAALLSSAKVVSPDPQDQARQAVVAAVADWMRASGDVHVKTCGSELGHCYLCDIAHAYLALTQPKGVPPESVPVEAEPTLRDMLTAAARANYQVAELLARLSDENFPIPES